MSRPWLEFISVPGSDKVRCPRCGKLIGHQRMARGAHAAWCLQQPPPRTPEEQAIKDWCFDNLRAIQRDDCEKGGAA